MTDRVADRADTGAREPQDSVSALTRALERIADLDDHPTVPASDRGDFAVQIARAALAAGVGVPPDADLDLLAQSAENAEVRAAADSEAL